MGTCKMYLILLTKIILTIKVSNLSFYPLYAL